MTADTPFRDISAGPAPSACTRPRRPDPDAPHRPASDEHPLLAAHGGVLTVEHLRVHVPYRPTWELQDELADQRRGRRIGDRLLLLEHFPVYTIGRGGDEANLLATPQRLRDLGTELIRIDRGGDITFHGPGQIVAYPIVELRDPLDLRRYVRVLEAAVIETAAAFGVDAGRLAGPPGNLGRRPAEARGDRRPRPARRHHTRAGAQRPERSALVRRDGPLRHPGQGRDLALGRAGADRRRRRRRRGARAAPGRTLRASAWPMAPPSVTGPAGGREQ